MSITSLSLLKTQLGITGTAEDALLNQLIPQAETAVKNYLRRQVDRVTVTEFYGGTGFNRLWLRKTPVQSIGAVYWDDSAFFGTGANAFPESSLLTEGTHYALERDQPGESDIQSMSGCVFRVFDIWRRPRLRSMGLLDSVPGSGMGNFKITYTAGWETVPADIVLATNQYVAQLRSFVKQGQPLQSESLDYYTYSRFDPAQLTAALGTVESLLAPYKKLVV